MESPFIDVVVSPAYGQLQARISWQLRPGFDGGRFTISRSPDGLNDWREIGNVERDNGFIDRHVVSDGKLSQFFYQVFLHKDGERYESAVISTLGALTRTEFGACYYIMTLEYKRLLQCNKILVYKLRTTSRRCPQCVDPDTGQKIGISLCQVCYGTGFEGGYWPGVISYMQLLTQSPVTQMDSAEGAGSTDPSMYKMRTLAYPPLIKNDMIVEPNSDHRYLVDTQTVSYLKGKAPIISMVDMTLLRRTDVRYKLAK